MKDVLQRNRHKLLKKANVVAVGIGLKVVDGEKTPQMSIVCSVRKKVPLTKLKKKDLIPQEIENVATDVVETGTIRALLKRTDRHRPAPGGVSIGHEEITAGTLGCLVKRNGQLYILSNNHVMANSNMAEIGDQILQPGKYDGGQLTQDMIARLADFVPIEFIAPPGGCTGQLLPGWLRPKALENLVDAAIAVPVATNLVVSNILDIGIPLGLNTDPVLGLLIQKSGRTTELTKGSIEQVDVTVQVQYGEGKIAVFTDQLMAGAMSSGGDSGSAVLDMEKHLVGLLFAGSDTVTVINKIEHVYNLLGLG